MSEQWQNSSGFRPLSSEDFATLAEKGGIEFPPSVQRVLNEALERLCRGDGNLDRQLRLATAKLLRRAEKGLADLIAIAELPTLEAELARKTLFPEEGSSRTEHVAYLSSLYRAARVGIADVTPEKRRPGKPPNVWYEYFVCIVADAFHEVGGAVSAAKQSGKGRRETPFLRVLRFVNSKLPERSRAECDATVDERAATAIPRWKGWRKHRGLVVRANRGETGPR